MIKRILTLLVGGFVMISIAVAFIPSITGIVTSGTSGVTKVLLDIGLWLIPLAVGFTIVVFGISRLRVHGVRTRIGRHKIRGAREEEYWINQGKRYAHAEYRRTGHW